MKDKSLGAIATAASDLEQELQNFERAADAAMRAPLRSQKNIDRAGAALNEAADAQTRVVEHIQKLMVCFNEARDRCQATSDALNKRGLEIEARVAETAALFRRFEEIGRLAHTTSDAVRLVGESAASERASKLAAVEQQLGKIVDDAQQLQRDAQAAELTDLAQQADGLRQQIHSARNKVSLAHSKLSS